MRELYKQLDGVGRRRFLEYAAKSALGVSVLPVFNNMLEAAPTKSKGPKGKPVNGKAKRLIYLYMAGAMTHLDTFDLKPGHKNQGDTKGIKTSVPGAQISEFLPTLAEEFDKMAVINSMYTETGAHGPGEYLMRTSYKEIASTRHPSMGPWIQRFRGRQNKNLPDTVLISAPARHPSSGFLDPSYSPLPIGDPNRGLENTDTPSYLSENTFEKRIDLINKFDKKFQTKFKNQNVLAYTDFYSQATSLLSSDELKAFDLNEEKAEDRDKYGRNSFGQGCMLARRLVENNVRCVEVNFGGWDMHRDIYDDGILPTRTGILDKALGNLLKELSERGLLDETLVVLTTEFGRTPVINQNGGRDHHPGVFSAALMGGGIKGGQFYGKSDKGGHSVDADGVLPADFNATIASALNLPLDKEIFSSEGRPFKVAHDGEAVTKLL
ncbi:DUF1501 domain-containing protein [Gimesia maris]|uniref:DUF1501 domain-containing protein n=1 Tax=Gimesia maris TaxID=122 RepID=A0A3D3RB40_9PLAN|nr:DUF1501 domain-containing protein [Gimesia maris]MAC56554.1 DUF1501 domain-containing protein [Gimesia sp.]EDL59851.1 hypothetical protein PM8797T_15868 [Gimesia maris DSM 8797]QDT78121.1 hypothetical protein Mal35_15520 [Gimesia maris]QEG15748.1 hypothetical protein GmarT_15910 [Gimesia maris]QGQ30972.1 DUF1501 domain-containing protein [Gimesia maris]|tara:strand:- start:57961 stop:59271 length:1311 start_codon:yes stop_codon:yes gene_type:complete